jgi:hypothetical protein
LANSPSEVLSSLDWVSEGLSSCPRHTVEAVNASIDNNADSFRVLDINIIYFLIICMKHGGQIELKVVGWNAAHAGRGI